MLSILGVEGWEDVACGEEANLSWGMVRCSRAKIKIALVVCKKRTNVAESIHNYMQEAAIRLDL